MLEQHDSDPLLNAFHHASRTMPYYRDILMQKGVSHDSITTVEDFVARVPLIRKEDVFPRYPLHDLCQNGNAEGFASAIVSSGTSGVFSYGLVTPHGIERQRAMIDTMMRSFFHADDVKPIIINALPMGVSFVSSYPVIPTSVRSDIVLQVIKTFTGGDGQFVIITDPHFLKKILEEGKAEGVSWEDIHISCIIGGTSFSDSLTYYLLSLLNGGRTDGPLQNHLFSTMGITEVGLNIFGSTPDLIGLRHILEVDPELRARVFGTDKVHTCPQLMYVMSESVHIEICNPDANGVGDIVMSHLDTSEMTMLIRYNTGDRGRFLEVSIIEQETGMKPLMPLRVVAIFGRESEMQDDEVDQNEVKEMLYRDPLRASQVTGHFLITAPHGAQEVLVQLKQDATHMEPFSVRGVMARGVSYAEFPKDIELSYEHKWKHTL